jgi:hypothetical protein
MRQKEKVYVKRNMGLHFHRRVDRRLVVLSRLGKAAAT